MVRTKQTKIQRYGGLNQSFNSSGPSNLSQENLSNWNANLQSFAVHMSQNEPRFRPAPVALVIPYESNGENSQNSVHTINHRQCSVVEDYSQPPQNQMTQTKRKSRYRPKTKALMEIRKYQRSTVHLIPHTPFVRLVKDMIKDVSKRDDLRIQLDAISALQDASETLIVTLFEAAAMCSRHCKRVTVTPSDFHLVRDILAVFGRSLV